MTDVQDFHSVRKRPVENSVRKPNERDDAYPRSSGNVLPTFGMRSDVMRDFADAGFKRNCYCVAKYPTVGRGLP